MKTAAVHVRMEPQTKRNAEDVLHQLGISPTEAIRIFYRQISLRGGLPFPVEIPNASTAARRIERIRSKEHGSRAEEDPRGDGQKGGEG